MLKKKGRNSYAIANRKYLTGTLNLRLMKESTKKRAFEALYGKCPTQREYDQFVNNYASSVMRGREEKGRKNKDIWRV